MKKKATKFPVYTRENLPEGYSLPSKTNTVNWPDILTDWIAQNKTISISKFTALMSLFSFPINELISDKELLIFRSDLTRSTNVMTIRKHREEVIKFLNDYGIGTLSDNVPFRVKNESESGRIVLSFKPSSNIRRLFSNKTGYTILRDGILNDLNDIDGEKNKLNYLYIEFLKIVKLCNFTTTMHKNVAVHFSHLQVFNNKLISCDCYDIPSSSFNYSVKIVLNKPGVIARPENTEEKTECYTDETLCLQEAAKDKFVHLPKKLTAMLKHIVYPDHIAQSGIIRLLGELLSFPVKKIIGNDALCIPLKRLETIVEKRFSLEKIFEELKNNEIILSYEYSEKNRAYFISMSDNIKQVFTDSIEWGNIRYREFFTCFRPKMPKPFFLMDLFMNKALHFKIKYEGKLQKYVFDEYVLCKSNIKNYICPNLYSFEFHIIDSENGFLTLKILDENVFTYPTSPYISSSSKAATPSDISPSCTKIGQDREDWGLPKHTNSLSKEESMTVPLVNPSSGAKGNHEVVNRQNSYVTEDGEIVPLPKDIRNTKSLNNNTTSNACSQKSYTKPFNPGNSILANKVPRNVFR